MSTYTLNHDDVVRTLTELAAERPDFVYEPQVDEQGDEHYLYCHKDGPGCIVGHVVAKLLPEFPLGNLDIDPAREYDSGTDAGKAIPRQGIDLELMTLDLLRVVQRKQDAALEWGAAVAGAFTELAEGE